MSLFYMQTQIGDNVILLLANPSHVSSHVVPVYPARRHMEMRQQLLNMPEHASQDAAVTRNKVNRENFVTPIHASYSLFTRLDIYTFTVR